MLEGKTARGGKVLICYSNPADTERLRLDLEHKMIQEVIESSGIEPGTVTRLHATTAADIANALSRRTYSIMQFSGHGSSSGIYVEGFPLAAGEELPATALSHIIQHAAPDLEALLCMSCFSSASASVLLPSAQFLLTISGEADDDVVIEFLRLFYLVYFRDGSVPKAFSISTAYLESRANGSQLNTVLSRRADGAATGRTLIYVAPRRALDAVVVDITDVEIDIQRLSASREEFLSILSRKVRLHSWIFEFPRDHAMLQMGKYFGEFSWKSPNDLVICHKIYALRPAVNEELCALWAELILTHNEAYISTYRVAPHPSRSGNAEDLSNDVEWLKGRVSRFLLDADFAQLLRAAVPAYYAAVRAQAVASIALAEDNLTRHNYVEVIIHLESVLSAMHDLINGLTEVLTVTPEGVAGESAT